MMKIAEMNAGKQLPIRKYILVFRLMVAERFIFLVITTKVFRLETKIGTGKVLASSPAA